MKQIKSNENKKRERIRMGSWHITTLTTGKMKEMTNQMEYNYIIDNKGTEME